MRSCSGLPADIIGLTDRGYIKPGLVADICVFDPQKVMDQATYDEPFRYSTGISYVLVGGQSAIYAGTPTGALAGKALRKSRQPVSSPRPADIEHPRRIGKTLIRCGQRNTGAKFEEPQSPLRSIE